MHNDNKNVLIIIGCVGTNPKFINFQYVVLQLTKCLLIFALFVGIDQKFINFDALLSK